jgi:H+/Cl- antiporter ClcA
MRTRQTFDRASHGGIVTTLLLILGVIVVLFAGYLAFVLNWAFSDGERAGVLQKFSRRGWVCKTWEGELAITTVPGVAPVIWQFSVRDDAAAAQLHDAVGQWTVLHYREHRGIPTTCFGETSYFVDSIKVGHPPALSVQIAPAAAPTGAPTP